jgi:carbon monoxide dehydrogenase subunit G
VAEFSHTVALAAPPAEAFAWLLEADRVPRWTGGLDSYEQLTPGPLGQGSRVRQVLDVSGQHIDVELHVTRYDPPRHADTRFSTNGIDVVSVYALQPDGAGSRLTQSLEAKATSLKARLLLPVIQPRLERKLTEDLERLSQVLAG